MTRDEALRKIKACLARSFSDNPNEAETALRQATSMMRQFGLTELDVEAAEITEEDITLGQRIKPWKSRLAGQIAQVFGCYTIRFYQRQPVDGWGKPKISKASVKFIGPRSAVEISAWCFEVCIRACNKAREYELLHYDGTPGEKSRMAGIFNEAWVAGVSKAVDTLGLEGEAYKPDTNEALAHYMEQNFNMTKAKNRHDHGELSDDEMEVWLNGLEKGGEMNLHVPVDGASGSVTSLPGAPRRIGND